MGSGGDEGDVALADRRVGDEKNNQCPMPNAQYPMPNAQFLVN
ncbi:MAG: histidine kinase [Nostoc sp.]